MDFFSQHKDKLLRLCLSDATLISTLWRKFLPEIRRKLRLEDATICGEIHGIRETEDDSQDPIEDFDLNEFWSMSRHSVSDHMRDSINVYCQQGGEKYPDEVPLARPHELLSFSFFPYLFDGAVCTNTRLVSHLTLAHPLTILRFGRC